ncbi:hypothetical protein RKD31_000612 [Streptomyces sp. SAI-163]
MADSPKMECRQCRRGRVRVIRLGVSPQWRGIRHRRGIKVRFPLRAPPRIRKPDERSIKGVDSWGCHGPDHASLSYFHPHAELVRRRVRTAWTRLVIRVAEHCSLRRSRQDLRVAANCPTEARNFAWDRLTACWPAERTAHRPEHGIRTTSWSSLRRPTRVRLRLPRGGPRPRVKTHALRSSPTGPVKGKCSCASFSTVVHAVLAVHATLRCGAFCGPHHDQIRWLHTTRTRRGSRLLPGQGGRSMGRTFAHPV